MIPDAQNFRQKLSLTMSDSHMKVRVWLCETIKTAELAVASKLKYLYSGRKLSVNFIDQLLLNFVDTKVRHLPIDLQTVVN